MHLLLLQGSQALSLVALLGQHRHVDFNNLGNVTSKYTSHIDRGASMSDVL